jgi:hypothetical protein
MAEEETWETLAKRLAGLIAKIDERDTHMVERLDALQTMLEEQREFNREQVAINQRLETLMQDTIRERHNGRTD